MQFPFIKLKNEVRAQLTKANALPPKASPDELLGELFQDVQLRRVHDDGKTFVDLVPAEKLTKILKIYRKQRHSPEFDLQKFVNRYFRDYLNVGNAIYTSKAALTAEQHIDRMWDVLQRKVYSNKGSLLALPYPYIVPGGRFSEQFYWDTYFVMLGLAASGRYDQLEGMIKNYAHLIRKIGYIPTANRTYLLSRSQPPFFSHMVSLLAKKQGNTVLVAYLPYMLQEYRFWMKGSRKVTAKSPAYRRVVLMPDGSILNRYFDSKSTPRPESYKEDVETAHAAPDRIPSQVYLDLRAGAESGWDFSSRWLRDHKTMATIHTTEIIPVDLNCLLMDLESTIARVYRLLKQNTLAKRFENRAEARAAAITKYCWSAERQFYFDYDFVADKQTDVYSLAGVFPLYSGAADISQAMAVAAILKEKFLQPGGLPITTEFTQQQWDFPNGWAPLHWIAIKGLRRYDITELADDIKQRWVAANLAVYKAKSKMVEKYDVADLSGTGGGGEYTLQDGFGWTNGVLLALLLDLDK